MCGLCGCTSLLGASLGLIAWCRLVLHLIRGSFLPFLPVTHFSLPLLPSETVLSTGSLGRQAPVLVFLVISSPVVLSLTCRLNLTRVCRGPSEAYQLTSLGRWVWH